MRQNFLRVAFWHRRPCRIQTCGRYVSGVLHASFKQFQLPILVRQFIAAMSRGRPPGELAMQVTGEPVQLQMPRRAAELHEGARCGDIRNFRAASLRDTISQLSTRVAGRVEDSFALVTCRGKLGLRGCYVGGHLRIASVPVSIPKSTSLLLQSLTDSLTNEL